jgi:hypothetical protein
MNNKLSTYIGVVVSAPTILMPHDNSGNDIWAIRKNDNEKDIYFS